MALSAIPSAWSGEEPAKLEKIMVTGSLAEPAVAAEPQRLDKIMVTGSQAKPMARVTAGRKR